jgi:hypothetical protein
MLHVVEWEDMTTKTLQGRHFEAVSRHVFQDNILKTAGKHETPQ